MKARYLDILSRITEEPSWYDQNGTPRYGEFHPSHCPNIYADTVVLLRIACQACCKEFHVEMHGDWYNPIKQPRELHYGDPPRHSCVGDSMNCDDLEVLQVWKKDTKSDWVRFPELEGVIE